jgi:hypothetical protein
MRVRHPADLQGESRTEGETLMTKRASWHTADHDNMWNRVKNALKNDWEQTKSDFGSKKARDMDQDVDDTVKQAAGSRNAFENHEQALRFGHAARRNFGKEHPSWSDALDRRLRTDYPGDYNQDQRSIRYAYEYKYSE